VMEVAEPVMEEEIQEEIYQEEEQVVMAPPKPIGRIPSIDQFPRIAQQQVAAQQHRIETIADHAKKRKGLFERLADVGLGRKTEHEVAPQRAQPAARRAEPKMQQQHVHVLHEEPAQAEASFDDDQLAIPAFLRRQANS
jgi:cell division protein FtsZ